MLTLLGFYSYWPLYNHSDFNKCYETNTKPFSHSTGVLQTHTHTHTIGTCTNTHVEAFEIDKETCVLVCVCVCVCKQQCICLYSVFFQLSVTTKMSAFIQDEAQTCWANSRGQRLSLWPFCSTVDR